MLDPRIYRAALLPIVVALLVVAFSLQDRPRPIGTTLATDFFDQSGTASRTLDELADAFPDRRAGSPQDDAMARDVAVRLRAALGATASVHLERFRGQTLDGRRSLVNVVGDLPGAPGPELVVVAHRDAAGPGAKAELSGTAALLELARVASDAQFKRTVRFVSTDGGSGGLAGARHAAAELSPGDVDAVLVLGDLAGARLRKPWVTGWAGRRGMTSLRLRRTLEGALRAETGQDAGGPRAATQLARMAARAGTGEQQPFAQRGLPAVLESISSERGPAASEPVDPGHLATFGRAALRTLLALDNGPRVAAGGGYVVTEKKLVPAWALRLLAAALLLPVWLATLDGFARARRRRAGVGRWVVWVLSAALPFALAAGVALGLGLTGLVDPAPAALLRPAEAGLDSSRSVTLGVLALVLILAFLLARPLLVRAAGPRLAGPRDAALLTRDPSEGAGPAAGVAVVGALLSVFAWVVNPFAALMLVPAVHLWLLVVAPEVRLPRAGAIAMVAGGALVPLVVFLVVCGQLGASVPRGVWMTVGGVAGGAVGPIAWLCWALACGCGVSALLVALRTRAGEDVPEEQITSRGPITYAGPGSLGGTPSSAVRR